MSAHRQQIYIVCCHVYGKISYCLHSVGMENYRIFFGYLAYLSYRLYRSHFIVGVHNRYERSIFSYRFFQIVKTDYSLAIHRQVRYFKTFLFKRVASLDNRRMLDNGRDNMSAFICVSASDSFNSPVVAFRSSGSKINFARLTTDSLGNLLSCVIHRFERVPAVKMLRRRVAVDLSEIWKHFLQNFGVGISRSRIVQINTSALHIITPLLIDKTL